MRERQAEVQDSARPAAPQKRYLTPADVAGELEVSVKTVMRAIAAGELEASKLTRRGGWRIRRPAVEAWLNTRSNRSPRRRRSKVPPALAAARRARGQLVVTPDMGRRV